MHPARGRMSVTLMPARPAPPAPDRAGGARESRSAIRHSAHCRAIAFQVVADDVASRFPAFLPGKTRGSIIGSAVASWDTLIEILQGAEELKPLPRTL